MIDEIKGGKTAAELTDISNYIQQSVSSMEKMITGVLDHAREGKISQEHEVFYIDELLPEIKKLITIPNNYKIKINCDFTFLPGSKAKILQVFLNLFTNSIKYNDKTEGRINITGHFTGNVYEFIFSDNGMGILQENLDTIFKLFKKGYEGNKTSHGIDLFTVKNIIEERGGKISVKSKVGEGTTFKFT